MSDPEFVTCDITPAQAALLQQASTSLQQAKDRADAIMRAAQRDADLIAAAVIAGVREGAYHVVGISVDPPTITLQPVQQEVALPSEPCINLPASDSSA